MFYANTRLSWLNVKTKLLWCKTSYLTLDKVRFVRLFGLVRLVRLVRLARLVRLVRLG